MKLEETVPSASIPSSIGEAALVRRSRTPVTVWIAMAFVAMRRVRHFGADRSIPNQQDLLLGGSSPARALADRPARAGRALESDRRGSNRVGRTHRGRREDSRSRRSSACGAATSVVTTRW
jgi:hypothetical protein